MNKKSILNQTKKFIKKTLEGESSGHDWWHTYRVWKNAIQVGKYENVDLFVVQLAALLHDIADWKLHGGDETIGPNMARQLLSGYGIPVEVIDHICEIISTMAFRGAGVKTGMRTLEGKVVQDADRLDAIGAIGIARAFAYGGYKNTPIYDPNQKPVLHRSKEEYVRSKSPTINHFYEKLLLLKNLLNTKTAKKIANRRHKFMKQFLERFFQEWEGKN